MDGVRAYWDGKQLLSRQGNRIEAPEEFLHGLPCGVSLDGELWMGRGTFEKLMSMLQSNQADWQQIQYYVFDMPSSRSVSHTERMEQLRHLEFPQHVHVVDHTICRGNGHLLEELALVSKHGGEGLVANCPDTSYQRGRTFSVLKIKVPIAVFVENGDCIVED